MRTEDSMSILVIVLVTGILVVTGLHIGSVFYFAGRMSEDKRFDEYVDCGVGTVHSGRYKMANRECLLVATRWLI